MSGTPAGNHNMIDRFMHALRHDPDAPTPPGLDAQTAAFVRRLVQAEIAPARLEPDQHARIWDKALRLAQTSADLSRPRPGPGRIFRHLIRSGDSPMLVSTPVPARRGMQLKWTGVLLPFAAAVLVVMVFAVISRFSPTDPNPGGGANIPPLGSAGDQAQRSTATPTLIPTAALQPTGTPFPVTMPDPMATPTAIHPDQRPADLTASPFPPTVEPPNFTATPILVTPTFPERAIPMNSATRDTISFEQPLVTYRVSVEEDGWVAVAVRPDDQALDLTLSYEVAQATPNGGGGGGAAGGGSLPLDEVGLFAYVEADSVLSLSVGAININAMGEGAFSLSVYQQAATPVQVDEPVEASLSEGQQAAIFSVESSANQLVDINVASDGSADLYVNVIEVSGDPAMAGQLYRGPITGCMHGDPLFCMDQDGGVRRDPELTDVTLLEGRHYLIIVRAIELNAEASFTLTLQPR